MNNPFSLSRNGRLRFSNGFTLVELMVAMLLGLIVIAGVTSVFLAGQRTYRTNDALGDVQDSSRIAFEMLARDIRDAGLTGCDTSSGRVSNVLNPSTNDWWADWPNALHGYDDATTDPALSGLKGDGAPVKGTSSVHVLSTGGMGLSVSQTPSSNSANFKINESTNDLQTGDVIMVCDFDHAAILQITNINSNNVTVVHNANSSGTKPFPGNCSKGLGYPTDCSSQNGNTYTFPPNSRVAKLTGVDWYIGTNPAGGQSLYRLALVTSGGSASTTTQEMVRNVTGMTISYLQPSSSAYQTATGIGTGWATVDAAKIILTVESTYQRAGTDAKPLVRSFTSTTTVRNRVH
ncbi:PilW family protein [Rhodanobacter sp. 115]|uniref:PilW family protein n=1 Tax=Rhodanobacter sp. FW021-MT20 TaxID=1162282 RepID=UPI0009D93368|nr:prepilin-type N-terminal cleavage/methylation domain-containing protein [Rhodanobacter sp. 115]